MPITFEKLVSGEYEAVAENHKFLNKVTLFKSGGESSLPRVCFSWQKRYYLGLTPEEAAKLDTPNILPSYEGRDFFVWARKVHKGETRVKHVTFMNFRRYGWCTAPGFDAGGGYSGIIYANGEDGGIPADSPEQVVRDTLVAAVAGLPACIHKVPRELVYSAHAREAFEFLLEDALVNISRHATPRRNDVEDKLYDIKKGFTGEIVG